MELVLHTKTNEPQMLCSAHNAQLMSAYTPLLQARVLATSYTCTYMWILLPPSHVYSCFHLHLVPVHVLYLTQFRVAVHIHSVVLHDSEVCSVLLVEQVKQVTEKWHLLCRSYGSQLNIIIVYVHGKRGVVYSA